MYFIQKKVKSTKRSEKVLTISKVKAYQIEDLLVELSPNTTSLNEALRVNKKRGLSLMDFYRNRMKWMSKPTKLSFRDKVTRYGKDFLLSTFVLTSILLKKKLDSIIFTFNISSSSRDRTRVKKSFKPGRGDTSDKSPLSNNSGNSEPVYGENIYTFWIAYNREIFTSMIFEIFQSRLKAYLQQNKKELKKVLFLAYKDLQGKAIEEPTPEEQGLDTELAQSTEGDTSEVTPEEDISLQEPELAKATGEEDTPTTIDSDTLNGSPEEFIPEEPAEDFSVDTAESDIVKKPDEEEEIPQEDSFEDSLNKELSSLSEALKIQARHLQESSDMFISLIMDTLLKYIQEHIVIDANDSNLSTSLITFLQESPVKLWSSDPDFTYHKYRERLYRYNAYLFGVPSAPVSKAMYSSGSRTTYSANSLINSTFRIFLSRWGGETKGSAKSGYLLDQMYHYLLATISNPKNIGDFVFENAEGGVYLFSSDYLDSIFEEKFSAPIDSCNSLIELCVKYYNEVETYFDNKKVS